MNLKLTKLSMLFLASGMMMSTMVSAATDTSGFGVGTDSTWSTTEYPKLTDMDNNDSAMGGNIRFTGRVVKATCQVATESKQIEVVLPVVPSNAFTGVGNAVSGANNETDFNIKLTECSNITEQAIQFRFTGLANAANDILNNEVEGLSDADGTGEAGATGVGVRVYSKGTANNGVIALNTTGQQDATSTSRYTIPGSASTHEFTANFTAGYAQNGNTVAPGLVKSTASFVVLYE